MILYLTVGGMQDEEHAVDEFPKWEKHFEYSVKT